MRGATKAGILGVVALGVAGALVYRIQPTEASEPAAVVTSSTSASAATSQPEALTAPVAVVPTLALGSGPRLVELGSGHCAGCKAMHKELAGLREDCPGEPEITEIDVFEQEEEAAPFGVRVIPTQVLLDADGGEIGRHEGFLSRAEILARFEGHGVACAE